MPVVIRRAKREDAAALSDLATRIFRDTFEAYNKPEDMNAFLASAYREDLQRAEIDDPNMVTLLAEVDGVLAGYAQVRSGEVPECVTGPEPVEILRFYVEKSFHGRGVAQRLMTEVEETARRLDAKTLWLGVWEKNDRAMAFYQKYGFRKVGDHPFLVGSDLQTDLVLERALQ
jgi:diamine N-acetyltransferase